jgi:iron complex transport system substrate-binding protein
MKPFKLYLLVIVFILGWWTAAFWPRSAVSVYDQWTDAAYPAKLKNAHLAPICRDKLHKALAGDVQLMTQLMADWEIEAQILSEEGFKDVRRLPRSTFLRGQKIGRQLQEQSTNELQPISYLPQTYVAASFLLALLPPEQIVAIPRGLRQQTQLFSPTTTSQIPLDVDRYSSETLYQLKPQVAFVAPYSHPATIEKLQRQGVALVSLDCAEDPKDIGQALQQVGSIVQHPLKGELLAMFFDAAMHAIDNRVIVLCDQKPHLPVKIVYLNTGAHYTLPTSHTLLGTLLARLGINAHPALKLEKAEYWVKPVDREMLAILEPDCLILSAVDPSIALNNVLNDPGFNQLPAIKNRKIFVVDEVVQEYPSQYILLAYYDLFNAILGALTT